MRRLRDVGGVDLVVVRRVAVVVVLDVHQVRHQRRRRDLELRQQLVLLTSSCNKAFTSHSTQKQVISETFFPANLWAQ